MTKFKVGDIVVPTEESNERYSITNKKSGYVGVVDCCYSDGNFEIKALNGRGSNYSVNKQFFELRDTPVSVITNQYQIY